jgi:hypothetical protein
LKEAMTEKLRQLVIQIVALLAACEYQRVFELTRGIRMKTEEIQRAIHDYGKSIVAPPDNAYQLLDIVRVRNTEVEQYSIRMPLWTQEEGRSDLTLGLTVKVFDDNLNVELDDIHVL